MRRIVALGATSAIVSATLRNFAKDGDALLLVARDKVRTDSVADDLRVRGAKDVYTLNLDLSERSSVQSIIDAAKRHLAEVDLVFIGYGTLTDQKRGEVDLPYALSEMHINFTSVVDHCLSWAAYFEGRKAGQIAVITSVAGERGRQSNYLYGAAKGGLSLFLGGLRNRLARSAVSVTDIRPGFVDTPMTENIKKGPLFASPTSVGETLYKSILCKKDIVYAPWFWRFIMLIIRMIPESIFKRLSL